MARVLIIDDEKSIRNSLREILEYEKFEVDEAEDGNSGLKKALDKEAYDLILCDIKMPQMDGIEVLQQIIAKEVESPVIMISGHGTIENAVEAIKLGAFDFISKPLDLNRLLVTLRNAMDRTELVQETKQLKKKVHQFKGSSIVGNSKAIQTVKDLIAKVAPTDARVMITGPNGTGKELVARSLHNNSDRAKGPFVEVNCAAIPSELIESELFGHVKGAFTSAVKDKKGKFEQAKDGTLFLDEIGDMSLSAQAKVLRALQENKISRVGGEKDISVNARVVAATNKDLKKAIENGNFREDLYHRLGVILIDVPALKDRSDDIPELTDYFLDVICSEQGIPVKSIKSDAIKELQKFEWTGNIRELRNVIERLVILCDQEITKDDIQKYGNQS